MADLLTFADLKNLAFLFEDASYHENAAADTFDDVLPAHIFTKQSSTQSLLLQTLVNSVPISAGFDAEDLIISLQNLLLSSSNIEEELLNFLGFDQLALIESIVQNKDEILHEIRQCNDSKQKPAAEKSKTADLPHVYASKEHTGYLTDFGGKFSLPVGTVRDDNQILEKFSYQPSANSTSEKYAIRTVAIGEFTPLARTAFKDYRVLNKMQSAAFPVAYKSNENMLVCAPTGAGKTDIATMVILKAIEDHIAISDAAHPTKFLLDKRAFKIIYVAPMKALAAEIVAKFTKKLAAFNVIVKECTGDMQLSRKDAEDATMIVTTPEKWDVLTRKSSNDALLVHRVSLIVIDEVHLLSDSRGPVIETIVARALRQVEISQKMVRIVGLSATLPNYVDVALFLGVDLRKGCFYFDNSFRPVPLQQTVVGFKSKSKFQQSQALNDYTFEVCVKSAQQHQQTLVFVHARGETARSARDLIERLKAQNQPNLFVDRIKEKHAEYDAVAFKVSKSKNAELRDFFKYGLGVHHAGMSRTDRSLVESLFTAGHVMILCCTATLAWGINLPAHTVVIKGTSVYDAAKGGFSDLNILDVLQIFGRAGRPQYESEGSAHLLTAHDRLYHYINMLISQIPIESQFKSFLCDNMNAEIVLGTVASVAEAVSWLKFSYLYIRMLKNPMAYGIAPKDYQADPRLMCILENYVKVAAKTLKAVGMIGYDETNGIFKSRAIGRIASAFYLKIDTMQMFLASLAPNMNETKILHVISEAPDLCGNIKVRDAEAVELERLHRSFCVIALKSVRWEPPAKTNVLIQTYISCGDVDDFALQSDTNYLTQNVGRILRAYFELLLLRGYANSAFNCLNLCLSFERRCWWNVCHPLEQFPGLLKDECLKYVARFSIDQLQQMSFSEILHFSRTKLNAKAIAAAVNMFPVPTCNATVQPITATVLRITLQLAVNFVWNKELFGAAQSFWINIREDNADFLTDAFVHNELVQLTPENACQPASVVFTIPVKQPLPSQIFVRIVSDQWIACDAVVPVSYKHLILPHMSSIHTELLRLVPLRKECLRNAAIEALYSFAYFNPIQTQIFHCLYHSNQNVLLGAPTGSGKTIVSEIAMWKALRDAPHSKVVYIAPLKALVKERIADWGTRLARVGLTVVELSGDTTPDIERIRTANVIVTTPEKWDGVSRDWKRRLYVQQTSLVIVDEIHLLGTERGPVLEIIVSRMRFIAATQNTPIRIVGLSTALANARDVASWLGIDADRHLFGLYNFRPSVRPVPLHVSIEGFAGAHYCPRMATMNKPCYAAILNHSPGKPVIVFVSSRRQTRLTADGIISHVVNSGNATRFLSPDRPFDAETLGIKDQALLHCLMFGVGIHHAGLADSDRIATERLFLQQKIQVLVATSTLAWGVNFPAHLVIVKGTEYYDARTKKYVDYPVTDILQMMGRAGRPQFDDAGKALILVHEPKKDFYKKFLYEPFPVESALATALPDHLNAEIAAGNVTDAASAVKMLEWTFLWQRIAANPTYYGLQSGKSTDIQNYLLQLVDAAVTQLEESGTVQRSTRPKQFDYGTEEIFACTPYGHIASFYYVQHGTLRTILRSIQDCASSPIEALGLLCNAQEFALVPVRHNEDVELRTFALAASLPHMQQHLAAAAEAFSSPHTKAFVLLVAHMQRVPFPIVDLATDAATVLEQAVRVLQAIIDVCVCRGLLHACAMTLRLFQMLKQAAPATETSSLHSLAADDAAEKTRLSKVPFERLVQQPSRYTSDKTLVASLRRLPKVRLSPAKVCAAEDGGVTLSIVATDENHEFNRAQPAICPRFPKSSAAQFFVVVAHGNTLLGLKRVLFGGAKSRSVSFSLAPQQLGAVVEVRWYVDSYIGLDAVQRVNLNPQTNS